jgi:hypothetical protein
MAFQPAPGVWKHEVFFTTSGVPGVNVLHTIQQAGTDEDGAHAAGLALRAAYVADVLPHKKPGFHVLSVVTTDLSVEGGAQAIVTGDDTVSSGTPVAPSQLCLVVQLLTSIRGRSFRGRVFDAGYDPNSYVGDGTVLPAKATDVQGAWNTFRGDLAAGDSGALCVLSRQHAGVVRASAINTLVTGVAVAKQAGVQRRRRNTAA